MSSESIAGLSRRERQVMDVLYARESATVSEILEALPDPPSYSAVRATLRILEEKGHVRHREDGPRYVYLPTVGQARAREEALRHVVRTFFNGSAEHAAMALLQLTEMKLTPEQLEALSVEVERAQSEGR